MGTAAAVVAGIGLGLQAYGTYRGLRAEEEAAKFNAQQARNNAEIIKKRIEDVRGVGAKAVKRLELDAIQVASNQVNVFAGNNIDVSSAVVGDIVEETGRVAATDVVTTLNNVEKMVWGLEVGQMNEESLAMLNDARAKSASKFAPISAAAGLLTGLGLLGLKTAKTDVVNQDLTKAQLDKLLLRSPSGRGGGIDPFGTGFGAGVGGK